MNANVAARIVVVVLVLVGVINMTLALAGCVACGGQRTEAGFFCQRIVVIPFATVLSRTVVECNASLIGGSIECATRRSHSIRTLVALRANINLFYNSKSFKENTLKIRII